MPELGKVLLIANPVVQSEAGCRAAKRAARLLRSSTSVNDIELALTEHAGHATELAAAAAGYDTLLALGGDGTVNEVMNGLMHLGREQRPRFGLIPYGSSNDYARSLKMPESIEGAIRALAGAWPVQADLGCCNGRYFAETLSFGLDTGTALSTVRRQARTGSVGMRRHAESSAGQLFHNKKEYPYQMTLEDGSLKSGRMYTFAVQVGRTYGGGFAICPDAQIDDGVLDICIGNAPIDMLSAVLLFLRAKRGKHASAKQLEFLQAHEFKLRFEGHPSARMDGEGFSADVYDVHVEPHAVTVLTAR